MFLSKFISIFFQCLIVSAMSIVVFIIFFCLYDAGEMFAKDIELAYGKRAKKELWKIRKKAGFIKKLLFWDMRHLVKRWHYVIFIINLVSAICSVIFLNAYVIKWEITGSGFHGVTYCICMICLLGMFITSNIMMSTYYHSRNPIIRFIKNLLYRVFVPKKYRSKKASEKEEENDR